MIRGQNNILVVNLSGFGQKDFICTSQDVLLLIHTEWQEYTFLYAFYKMLIALQGVIYVFYKRESVLPVIFLR